MVPLNISRYSLQIKQYVQFLVEALVISVDVSLFLVMLLALDQQVMTLSFADCGSIHFCLFFIIS